MPNKHNEKRRHHIPKMKFKVTNWAEYDDGLRRRGSLTLWVTDEAIASWQAAPRLTPGGSPAIGLAIETALMLRLAFHLPLAERGTDGVGLRANGRIAGHARPQHVESPSDDDGINFEGLPPARSTIVSWNLTGLKVYGVGEWVSVKAVPSLRGLPLPA